MNPDKHQAIDTPELDNNAIKAEELMMLWPDTPVEVIIDLCQGIQEDEENGYYKEMGGDGE